jgi:hypothetical protein
MTIIRNPDGFATANVGERHADYKRMLPFDYVSIWEDFSAAASGVPAGWTHTNTNGTLALASGTLLTQTLGGADNDLSQLYATTAIFPLTAGKKAFFRWRGKVDKGSTGTIGEQELYVGMSSVQTGTNFIDAAGTALAVDDFVGFASYDGGVNIDVVARKTDVLSTLAAVTTYADVTFMDLACDFDGVNLSFYKDSTFVGQLTSGFPTAALAPMIYFKGGEAKAAVLTTDYIWFAAER